MLGVLHRTLLAVGESSWVCLSLLVCLPGRDLEKQSSPCLHVKAP